MKGLLLKDVDDPFERLPVFARIQQFPDFGFVHPRAPVPGARV